MPAITVEEIKRLCQRWCDVSTTPDGGIRIGIDDNRLRLVANGVRFYELDRELLCTALTSLSKILLLPGLNTIISVDHLGVWSWCGELLLGSSAEVFPEDQYEIKKLYMACIHAALAGHRKPKPNETKEEFFEQNRLKALQPHHSNQLIANSNLTLAYLTFPLLEAVLKRACASFVSFDGKVIAKFSVTDSRGQIRKYSPNGSYRDRKCSSLRDLLELHITAVASEELKSHLEQFYNHFKTLHPETNPFDLIYSWRNQSLHGSTNYQTIGGSLLSLALLISIFEIQDFEERRFRAFDEVQWMVRMNVTRAPWSMYPPY